MTTIWCNPQPFLSQLLPGRRRIHGYQCCSSPPNHKNRETQTPQLVKVAVSGVTELLRLFSFTGGRCVFYGRIDLCLRLGIQEYTTKGNLFEKKPLPFEFRQLCVILSGLFYYRFQWITIGGMTFQCIDEVLSTVKSDYEKAYFVTGLFTSAIYAEDCTFEDPTIKFRGKELYSRNLSLLVPFFEDPSIQLKKIEKGISSKTEFIVASWTLRTYLKLPWKPFIFIDGKTVYDLDEQFRIVRHVESWNISALEAIGQIFTPSFGRPDK